MLHVKGIVGHRDEAPFRDAQVECVEVAWDEATKRRLRRVTDRGTDVAIDLPPGSFLADGAVLHAEEALVVVVVRPRQPAVVVHFSPGERAEDVAGDAFRLGHSLGNQHVPADVEKMRVAIPITTSAAILRDSIERLDLRTAHIEVAEVPLWRDRRP